LNFQIAFGPDGALYFCQGSMTSVGGPDKKWNLRHEHLLSAACLRLDAKLISTPPLDVKTEDGGKYDPRSTGAPLTIYATGLRSGFDLLWHRNGNLYTGLNGAAAGGNVPAGPNSPGIANIKETTEDLLLKITPGAYFGHPNPARGQFVLMGGNPTAGVDPQEITEYPVGTDPEKNFTLPMYDFGKSVSPNGLCEYIGTAAFGGALDGKILVTRYSGGKDVIVLTPGSGGKITEAVTGIDGLRHFSDPLDLVEDLSSGNLYVAEYAGRQLTLLVPRTGASKRVFKQTVAP
jgi:glucose/arabinose dehydrogenase